MSVYSQQQINDYLEQICMYKALNNGTINWCTLETQTGVHHQTLKKW